jgi:hypothetical protein
MANATVAAARRQPASTRTHAALRSADTWARRRNKLAAQPTKPRRIPKPSAATVTMPDGSTYTIHRLTAKGISNAKMALNEGHGFRTVGIVLAPHRMAGIGNLCPHASPGCIALCLNESGRTAADNIIASAIFRARIARARLYYQDRAKFLEMLTYELTRERDRARRDGEKLIVRPNVLSDIDWPRAHPEIVAQFPDVQFYGYTKNPIAYARWLRGEYPSNYYLTFSRSETNEAQALGFLAQRGTVAMVFDTIYSAQSKRPLPATYKGFIVVDGDLTDLRFLDPTGVIIGLRAKGRARRPAELIPGFVIPTDGDKVAPRAIEA